MKEMVFELKGDLYKKAFEDKIEERTSLLLVILEACRYMMYNIQIPNAVSKFMLVVDEMSRLFFCRGDKMFSVMFPFQVKDYPSISFEYEQIPIDSKLLSMLIGIVSSNDFKSDYALDFITPIGDLQDHEYRDFWKILRFLMTCDIGYIRYEDDPEGFRKASRNGMPKQHPRYHYDVNIASQASFKLGLSKKLMPDDFINFLNNKKDRYMVK